MNSYIRRVVTPPSVAAALGTTNAALLSVAFTNVLSDLPLGGQLSHNNGLVDTISVQGAETITVAGVNRHFYRVVNVRQSSYGAVPMAAMTAEQLDALVNPTGVDIPAAEAQRLALVAPSVVALIQPSAGFWESALHGAFGDYYALAQPAARLPRLLGLIARYLSLAWLGVRLARIFAPRLAARLLPFGRRQSSAFLKG